MSTLLFSITPILSTFRLDNAKILKTDPCYKTIPIVISSTKPKNTHKTVGDTLSVILNEAGSASSAVIGTTNKPLEVARKRSELQHDLAALLRAPTIKNPVNLGRFLDQRGTAAEQNRGLDASDDEEEED